MEYLLSSLGNTRAFLSAVFVLFLSGESKAMEKEQPLEKPNCPIFNEDSDKISSLIQALTTAETNPQNDRKRFEFDGKTWYIEPIYWDQIVQPKTPVKYKSWISSIEFLRTEIEGKKRRCFYRAHVKSVFGHLTSAFGEDTVEFRITMLVE